MEMSGGFGGQQRVHGDINWQWGQQRVHGDICWQGMTSNGIGGHWTASRDIRWNWGGDDTGEPVGTSGGNGDISQHRGTAISPQGHGVAWEDCGWWRHWSALGWGEVTLSDTSVPPRADPVPEGAEPNTAALRGLPVLWGGVARPQTQGEEAHHCAGWGTQRGHGGDWLGRMLGTQ